MSETQMTEFKNAVIRQWPVVLSIFLGVGVFLARQEHIAARLEERTEDRYTATEARRDFAYRDAQIDALFNSLQTTSENVNRLAISTARLEESVRLRHADD